MSNKKIIYITASENICNSEWMKVFVKNLQMTLLRTSRSNLTFFIKDTENTSWIENIKKSNVFIIVLDKNDEKNEKYLNELYAINDQIQELNQVSTDSAKLYKICLSPDIEINQPASFKSINSYQFYTPSKRKGIYNKLDFNKKSENTIAWNLMLDLAFNFRDDMSSSNEKEVSKEKKDSEYIYLARCSSDLAPFRNELKRELNKLGYTILPYLDSIGNIEEERDILKEDLKNSSLIVQLLGEKYGEILKHNKISLLEKEHVLINETIRELPHLKRLIWVPDFLKKKDQRQELFINRIKQKESSITTEVVESSMDELKDILIKLLTENLAESKNSVIEGEVYLIATPETRLDDVFKNLADSLNLEINTLELSDKSSLYHQHIELLTTSNNILIHWVNNDVFWLKSKLSDLIKAPGLGKNGSYNSIGILVNGTTPDLSSVSNWLPNINIIQHDNIEELKEYFQRIIE